MSRTTHLLSLATLVLSTVIVTMIATPADANKPYAVEQGDIAFVDVFNLVDKALLAEDKATVRADFNAQSQEAITGLQKQLADLEAQLTAMDPSDPAGATIYQEYQALQAQLQNASQQINASYQTLIAQQIAEGYEAIYAATNEVAKEQGYAFVFATRANGELVQTDTITGITQEILARPLVTPPTGVDITELVRVKLGYPEKAPEPEAPAVDAETEPATEPTVVEPTEPAPADQDGHEGHDH